MSEHRPTTQSYKEFLATIDPAAITSLKKAEREAAGEYGFLGFSKAWLEENQDNPLADPNHRLYYEQEVVRIENKLEQPYG